MPPAPSETKQPVDILVVDDTLANIQVLSAILKEKGYKVRPVLSGKTALQAVKNKIPDLILLDISMPEMNGYEVCDYLKKDPELMEIPIIFVSALSEPLDKVKAFSLGGVDYITKPFQLEEVQARVETHLRLRHLQNELEENNRLLQFRVQEQIKEINALQMATIKALAKATEYKDEDTGAHIERIQYYCEQILMYLKTKNKFKSRLTHDFIRNVISASILHDIGKVRIPDNILLKPGKHTPEEFEEMKRHTIYGSQLLKEVQQVWPNNSFINTGIEIARSHHERWDGTGYPDGLKDTSIPLSARTLAIADVYDALRSRRPYKDAFSHEKSCSIIQEGKGTHFDPDLVDAFLNLEKTFDQAFNEHI